MGDDTRVRVLNESDVQLIQRRLCARGAEPIASDALSLIELDQQQIHTIVSAVPGGAKNIEDIYPLTPMQEGMLFHRLMSKQGDTYVISTVFTLRSASDLSELITAIQQVIDRHDVLRASIHWEGLPRSVQVIHREAKLPVEQFELDATQDPVEQMKASILPGHQQFELREAPLVRLKFAEDHEGQWYAVLQSHHLACDDQSWRTVIAEVMSCLDGREADLPAPVPYKSHVADALAAAESKAAEKFFRGKIGTVEEPTVPFGLVDVHGEGTSTKEAIVTLPSSLAMSIREQARRYGVSAAGLFHAGWALVVASTSGRDDVVFGTVLLTHRQRKFGAGRMVGLSINTLPLRLRLRSLSAKDLVELTHREIPSLFSHQHAPLELVKRCSGVSGGAPLFTALLNYRQRIPDAGREITDGSRVRVLAQSNARTNYPITMSVDDVGDDFVLIAQTDPQVEPARMVAYLQTAMQSMVDALEHKPDALALSLTTLAQDERRVLIEDFNAAYVQDPQEKLIHEIFEQQVRRTPDAVAITYRGESYTYAELNARANRLAHYLGCRCVGAERRVGICVERGLEMVVGLIAVLKAGATYVPLDPAYPSERLSYMLADAAPAVLLTQSRLKEKIPITTVPIVWMDDDWPLIEEQSSENASASLIGAHPHQAAYVIYTSGSTGRPKGVVVEHRNVTRLFEATDHWFGFDEKDVWTLFHSFAFDFSVWEIFGALLHGGRLVVVPHLTSRSSQEFYKLVCEERVTVLCQTPSAFTQFINAQTVSSGLEHALRFVIFGGEGLEVRSLRPWVKNNGASRPHLVNMYGITETTVHVTYRAPLTEDEIISDRGNCVGKPIPDLRVYVLDEHQKLVPIGVTGEIYVGGAGLARGYLNQLSLTATRFIADPFSREHAARMYKTGDLGAWHADGTIEYLGRNDQQVKIRGFRIELGEIEAELERHERIREAVVLPREDVPGDKRLIAYVIPCDKASPPSLDTMRGYLKSALPEHMIPSAYIILDQLPLTQNGKLDRGALPVPDISAFTAQEYEPPQGELEEIMAGIWRDLLRLKQVGRHDNFFELGGHSLLILQMMDRLRRVGLSLEARRVFESPTLSALVSGMASPSLGEMPVPPNLIPADAQSIEPHMLTLADLNAEQLARVVQVIPGGSANVQDIYPLTPLQEGILFHHILNQTKGDVYVIPTLLALASREKLNDLVAAVQHVVDRHDVLRTAILWEQLPRPIQVVYRRATVSVTELQLCSDQDAVEQLRALMKTECQRIDLSRAPLVDLQIASGATGQWYAIVRLHHIVDDATSMKLLISEIVSHIEGRSEENPEVTPYRDHVARVLAYAQKEDAEEFFKRKLASLDEPTAPFGLVDIHEDGTQIRDFRVQLEIDIALRLRAQARRVGVTTATLFHAAWGLVIATVSSKDDVVFGTVLLGRLQWGGNQQTLGMFINTLPLRLQLKDVTVKQLIDLTQRELIELLAHEQAPLVIAQQCSGITGSVPLFSSLFNYRHKLPGSLARWSDASGIRVLGLVERTNYPITVSIDDEGEGFSIVAHTDRRVDPARLTGYLHTALRSIVTALEQTPDTPVSTLTILPESEQRQLMEFFNATQALAPEEHLVHTMFERQVARTPQAVAVVGRDHSLTYEEVNHAANRLAQFLIEKGIRPDDRVGVCLDRGPYLVIGLIGVLKSGAAYVPLDPSYPPDRLLHMLEDADPRLILTEGRLMDALPIVNAEVADIALVLTPGREQSSQIPPPTTIGMGPRNLVYVIYTSGSTGKPKGTAMPHAAMVNLIHWHREYLPLQPEQRVLQFAALSFDVAFQEVFSTLCCGGSLVLIDESMRRDAPALVKFLQARSVSRLFLPPLMLQSIAEHAQSTGEVPSMLRQVITAGEQLRISPTIRDFFRQLAGCELHNHYGPTETHVVTALTLAGNPEDWPELPSIGRPITNTQIHILDRSEKLVPIGVVGELYIGGANVANGYLHRPELTAQRFVRNPVSSDPQRCLYRTGDLGRWREDGSIEYLGRNDHQVKIRGYRIELGEIEAQLVRHQHVKDAAVIATEDTSGARRLVAYVTPRDGRAPSAEELRTHLKDSLADHMVPSAFVSLEALPVTPSGKLDRRALPSPELGTFARGQQYEAPQGSVEIALATIWQDLLQIDRVGRRDDFFELGGHSLLVLKALSRMQQAFARDLTVKDLYRYSTLSELASHICGNASEDEPVDLECESALDECLVPHDGCAAVPTRAMLITGATGFLGRFLLRQLLRESDARIYCLVRATNQLEAAARLKATLEQWDLWRERFSERLIPIVGSLRLPRLGMDERTYYHIAAEVDSIYNCATSMNHLETYATARGTNVDGCKEIVRLAVTRKPKLINHVSTLGIFGAVPSERIRFVEEFTPIDQEVHPNSSGYLASKWVGEKIFMRASERGIPCNIFRIGLAWADAQQGRYDELQREYRLLNSCFTAGVGIEGYRCVMPPTPIDYIARAIVFLSGRHHDGRGIFHLSSSGKGGDYLFERCNNITGNPLILLPHYEWIQRMKQLSARGQHLPIVPLIEYAFSMDEASFNAHRSRTASRNICFDCSRTQQELEQAGIMVPELTDELLEETLAKMLSADSALRDWKHLIQIFRDDTSRGVQAHA